eukprot:m.66496 g.66496  ORF g.66496 m.66496 type:complete len:259 (-) comp15952_c0_seq1:103-879(-)
MAGAMATLLEAAKLDFGIQAVAGAVAIAMKTEKWYDLTGGSTFALCTALAYIRSPGHVRQLVQTSCVTIWAARLSGFLFLRVLHAGEDKRFKLARNNPKLFAFYWFLQGVWIFVSLLPTLLMLSKTQDHGIQTRDLIGWGMWAAGFLFESIADYQKFVFRKNAANADKFIRHGLWSTSRHPNYFGEILLWSGLFVSASSSFDSPAEWLSVVSPAFVTFLLTKVSGIPILEKMGRKKFGSDPAYQTYLQSVPLLIPSFF